MQTAAARPLIIGIGNPDCGDDAAGPLTIAALQRFSSSLDTATCLGDLTRLMDLWEARDEVVLVDMISMPDGEPGTIFRFDAESKPLPYEVSYSSHGLSVSQCIEMARTLGALPQQLAFIGICGANAAPGAPLNDAVRCATQRVAKELAQQWSAPEASGA